jgi:hypothetical protein
VPAHTLLPPVHAASSSTQSPLTGSQQPPVQVESAQHTLPGVPHDTHVPGGAQRWPGSQLLPFSTHVPSWHPHADEHAGLVLQHA